MRAGAAPGALELHVEEGTRMSVWRDRCRSRIADLTRDLPVDADLKVRRKALWGKGFAAHQGTVWGRKVWGQEVRAYLARHGDSLGTARRTGFAFPDHIHFPFRDQEGPDA